MDTQPSTQNLVAHFKSLIAQQEALEIEADLPDLQCGMVSLLYARQALGNISADLAPADYLRRYAQLLENRYSRIQAEDAGEYGSGRDALAEIIEACSQLAKTA
jgi:hypothetical protein